MPLKSNQDRTFSPVRGLASGILTSWIRRLASHIPETLTGLVAIFVFGALFLHVFRDLLSPEMLALAPVIMSKATWAGIALILGVGFILSRRTLAAGDLTLGWGPFGQLRGLPMREILRLEALTRLLWATVTGALTGGAAITAGHAVLTSPIAHIAVFAAGFLLCTLPALVASGPIRESKILSTPHINRRLMQLVARNPVKPRGRIGRIRALSRWRAGLILRTPTTWMVALAWVLCMAGLIAATLYQVPLPFVALFAWLAGWLASLPIALHAASEAGELPFEEAFGVTRKDIASAYLMVSIAIAALGGFMPALILVATGNGVGGGANFDHALTCLGAGAMAPSLMPFLLWQVDPRRPLVQALTALFSSMFLATAIIATKAAFLLWPVVLILLAHQQNKRILHEQTTMTGI